MAPSCAFVTDTMSLEPQRVLLNVMDSSRTPATGNVLVERLSMPRRAGRAILRTGMVSGGGAILALLPLLHGCGLITLLVAGPVYGFMTWRKTVLLGEGQVSCPKCQATVAVADKTPGWPARMHCGTCGSTFFIRPAE